MGWLGACMQASEAGLQRQYIQEGMALGGAACAA